MTTHAPSAADGVDPALLAAIRDHGLTSLEAIFEYGGGQDLVKRNLAHRRRTQVSLTDAQGRRHELYLKRYAPEPIAWRLRRLWTYGRGGSPASIEAANIQAAADAGIATMRAVAFGSDGSGLGAGRSYIIVTAVPGEALSRCMDGFLLRHAADGAPAKLAMELAALAGRMHRAGLAHRDFYTAHIFLDERGDDLRLCLIDLARMFRPRPWRRFRWQVKDLAGLKFSLSEAFVRAHWPAVMREYMSQAGVRADMLERFERAVDRKVRWMAARLRNRPSTVQ